MNNIISAGIIAAGEGSRFIQAGILTPKPLISVAGYPLIGRTLKYYQSLGIQRVVIIFNEQESDCVDWVRQHFPSFSTEIIVKSHIGLGAFFNSYTHDTTITALGIFGFLMIIFIINKLLWLPLLERSHKMLGE